jgi:hypothetical protein
MNGKEFSRICTFIGLFLGLIVAWDSASSKELSMSDMSMGGSDIVRCDDCDKTIDAGTCHGSTRCEKVKLTTCVGTEEGKPWTMDCHVDQNYCEETYYECDENMGTAVCKD